MASDKTTRRVYSAEELHRLRASCSQPKLREAIEEHDAEDAELVKEHVLRGSKSFAARSFRSRASGNSLRVPCDKENRSTTDIENARSSSGLHAPLVSASVLGEIAPNGQILRSGPYKIRPSPTPSLKKKKAEAIVKAHGSPQHVRVTAGGRIVPSEQSPLCHPRYGYSAIKANGGLVKFAPNHPMGKAQWTQATQNGFVAQDVNGRLCQIVNGTILPLNEVDGALRLYIPAPNLNIATQGSSFGVPAQSRHSQQAEASMNTKPPGSADPSIATQTNALELEYSKLEHELKELDKTEVLHGRTMGKAAKEALVSKRRELVTTLDRIRKAIKSLKVSGPPPDAPTSPKAMQHINGQSVSPPRNRLPVFLQQHTQQQQIINNTDVNTTVAGTGTTYVPPIYGMMHPEQSLNGQFAFQTTPSPDGSFGSQSLGIPMAPMFVPPPPFDGSIGPPLATFNDTNVAYSSASAALDAFPTQTDGARSFVDLQKISNGRRESRAVGIKAPEPKQASVLKSSLNPMSPAYKPGAGVLANTNYAEGAPLVPPKSIKDRVPTPLSPLHQLRPPTAVTSRAANANATDDTISPTKKSPGHLHSSSVSSFETADFFPRDTREYSTRKHTYPEPTNPSEDKENISPAAQPLPQSLGPSTPADGHAAPAPPPSTPATREGSGEKTKEHALINTAVSQRLSQPFESQAVLDRQIHNLSPKTKRQGLVLVEERSSQQDTSLRDQVQSFDGNKHNGSSLGATDVIDFTQNSIEWIEGYRAGLARRPVGSDRAGDFLDGYCAGLLKSKPSSAAASSALGPSTGGPIRSASRRPSPVPMPAQPQSSSSHLQLDHLGKHQPPIISHRSRPVFEMQTQSTDSLKQAIFAPSNENAVLTPGPEGPSIGETGFNLGAWSKHQAPGPNRAPSGFPFPNPLTTAAKRQGVMSGNDAATRMERESADTGISFPASLSAVELSASPANMHAHPQTALPAVPTKSIEPSNMSTGGSRVNSITSIDSTVYRPWPGHGQRVFSPNLEWKSATSIAHAAGLATGYFANAQFDGAHSAQQRTASITSAQTGKAAMATHTRFKESSLDGITNSPASPRLSATSPEHPRNDVISSKLRKKEGGSSSKPPSPAKVKFEHIAEKVGIKVSSSAKGGSPESPQGKKERRWRDVWRGSKKDEGT